MPFFLIMEMEVETKLMPLKFFLLLLLLFLWACETDEHNYFFYLLAIIEVALPARRWGSQLGHWIKHKRLDYR